MSAKTLSRVSALARRDLALELTYHFQLFLWVWSTLISVATFFFLDRLVGDAQHVERYRGGYFGFALVGLVVMAFSQVCVSSFAQTIEHEQSSGTLEILLATATPLPTLMAGTLVVPFLFASAEALLYLVLGWAVSDLSFSAGALVLTLPLLFLTLGTFAAVGILSAAAIVLTKRGDPFSTLALQASNLLAGAVFPVAVLPGALQSLARAVPAFYGLRGGREVLLAGGGLSDIGVDLLALVGFNIVLLPVSMWALSHALRIARVTGTLGNV